MAEILGKAATSFNHKNGKYCRPFSGVKYQSAVIPAATHSTTMS